MWTCPVCSVPCQDKETQCPACETARPGTEKSAKLQDRGPPVVFGAGAPKPFETNVPNPFAAQDSTGSVPLPTFNPFAQTGPISFGTAPLPTDGSRFTFGRSDPLEGVSVSQPEAVSAGTPVFQKGFRSPTTFCAAMETPLVSADAPLLLGLSGELKVDSTLSALLAAEEGAVFTWGSGECDQLAVRQEHLDGDGVRRAPIVIKRLAKAVASRVCCGTMHSAAIVDGGKALYTWGCNDEAALGRPCKSAHVSVDPFVGVPPPSVTDAERHHAKVPASVWGLPNDVELRAVSAGDSHTAVITTAGDCYCWGAYRDAWGPIGFPMWGDDRQRFLPKQPVPTKVPGLKGACMELVSGENHTAVLTYSSVDKKERIYVWGANDCGQLGVTPASAADETSRRRGFVPMEWTVDRFEFKLPAVGRDENEDAVMHPHPLNSSLKHQGSLLRVFAGRCTLFFTVDLNGEARTFGMGRNASGELGCGAGTDQFVYDPVEVLALKGTRWKDLKGGDWFTLGLSHDGSVFSWGHREYVGLGSKVGRGDTNVLKPTLMPGLRQKVRAIGAGSKTGYVLTLDGRLFAWGDNQVAQVGDGTDADEPVFLPTYVAPPLFGEGRVLDVAGGAQHAIALVKHLAAAPAFAALTEASARGEKRLHPDPSEVPMEEGAEVTDVAPEPKKPRLSAVRNKQADFVFGSSQPRPSAPPPTPAFPDTGMARPTRLLPEDIAEDVVTTPQASSERPIEEEFDSVPHIKRPFPAPAEPESPILTSAAKRLKAELAETAAESAMESEAPAAAETHLDEFGDDPGHDADVSNNLEASQVEEDEPEASTMVPEPTRPVRHRTRAPARKKKGTVSEKEAEDKREAERELAAEPPVKRTTRRKAAAPKAAPKRQASRTKASSPPRRVTRSRAKQ